MASESQQPHGQTAEIPIDSAAYRDDDNDSALDDQSILESTASLTDSIWDYRKIHGRTFQVSKTTEYWGPNDDQQNQGLDVNHHWMTMLFDDKLYLAPIGDNPQTILDVGTGTGIWAIDMADEHPDTTVIGTDISPIQPPWVPPNCEFQLDDAQLEWTWPENHFDFIHIRNLEGSINDWPALYKRAFKHCKPGGWIEDVSLDIETRSDSPLVGDDHVFRKWGQLFLEAGERLGKTFKNPRNHGMKTGMEAAGFVDVVERKWKVPIGAWSSDPKLKQIGSFLLLFVDQSLEGFALFLLKEVMGWEYNEIQVIVSQMRSQLRSPKIRPYVELHVVYGRKPEEKEKAAT